MPKRPKLLDYCNSKGIHCTAYSCLGGHTKSPWNNHLDLVENPTVLKVAEQRNKTPAQILYVALWRPPPCPPGSSLIATAINRGAG